jgi:hypothetical protein
MTNKPKRIQRKRSKGYKLSEAAGNGLPTVYVGRGSGWGNPYKVGVHGTVDECIDKYIRDMVAFKHGDGMDVYLTSEATLTSIILDLHGKNLACWCKENEPCHADWLLEIANDSALIQSLELEPYLNKLPINS